MRSRTFAVVALLVAILLFGSVGVYAYDHARAHTIATGVTVANVPVGGLTADQARARLRRRLLPRLARPVVVRRSERTFRLTPRQAHVTVDLGATVDEAVNRSREGSIITRTSRAISGGRLDVNLEPQVSYSNAAVDRLVGRVARATDRPAVESDVSFTPDGPHIVAGHDGAVLERDALRRAAETALSSRSAQRRIVARVRAVHPHRSRQALAARYPVILALNRSTFQLRLYKRLRLTHTYTVAVGQVGLETPAGLYHIQNKQVDPSWHVPNSAWAGSLAGKVIPPGPQDPIKARWMGIFDGAGIHGTDETYSLGHSASHGCVRMAIPDVIALYPQVPVGTPIYIG